MIQFSMAHPSLEGPGNLKVVQCLPVVFRWVLLLAALMGSLKEVISFGCTHGQPRRGHLFWLHLWAASKRSSLLAALMGSLEEIISFGCTHGQPQRGLVFQTLSPKDTNCLLVLDVHAWIVSPWPPLQQCSVHAPTPPSSLSFLSDNGNTYNEVHLPLW